MAALIGTALLRKFTTVCEVSLPGPAPTPGFAARPATSGASRLLTTRLCQQKSIPPSRPFAPCLVLCSVESAIGLLLAARPASCACSPSNSKDANKSVPRNSSTAPASNPPSASARCDFRQAPQSHQTAHDQCWLVQSTTADRRKQTDLSCPSERCPRWPSAALKGMTFPRRIRPSRIGKGRLAEASGELGASYRGQVSMTTRQRLIPPRAKGSNLCASLICARQNTRAYSNSASFRPSGRDGPDR